MKPERIPSLLSLEHAMHASAARVYRLVWLYCERDGVCRVPLRDLGRSTGLSASNVLYHLRALVRDGYLQDLGAENARYCHRYALTARRLGLEPLSTSPQADP